jgi:hypothetical protein
VAVHCIDLLAECHTLLQYSMHASLLCGGSMHVTSETLVQAPGYSGVHIAM